VATSPSAYYASATNGAPGARWISLERRFLQGGRKSLTDRVTRECSRVKSLWRTVVLKRSHILAALAAAFAIAALPHAVEAQDRSITIFAAASMKNALDDVDAAFTKKSGIKVVVSYDASSALMKQIEGGAQADAFVSADLKWMDYGSQKKLIKDDTRVNLLGNVLVLIAPKDSKIDHVTIGPEFDLAKLAGDGKVATGDVKAVPVGIYAQAALQKLGAWDAAAPKMAMTANVRAALVLVARGEAALGIVYATDAKVEPGVKVVGVFPDSSHDPIIYPVAATATAKPDVTPYLAFLRSAAAKTIFESYGFSFLVKSTS
jgi:molybdate transport system substrate-binding protein